MGRKGKPHTQRGRWLLEAGGGPNIVSSPPGGCLALSKDGLLPAAGERGPCTASVRPVTSAPRLVCPCSRWGAGAGAPMGKGGGTSWPRPAVCLASVPRAQRPRRAAQNPLHEAPIPACAWTGPHPGPRHLWSSSPFPQASDRKARLLHVAWTSASAPATSRHSVHTERRTRPATHSSVPWKGGPVCPPPATPARGCGAACGHVQRGARTDPVGLQALGVGGASLPPPAGCVEPRLPTGEGWGRGVGQLRGGGAGRAALVPPGPGPAVLLPQRLPLAGAVSAGSVRPSS